MKKHIACLCLLLWSMVSAGQFSQADSVVRSRFVRVLGILASDSLSGRGSGTEGERKAARYISREMEQCGLVPRGDSGSWTQRFTITKPDTYGVNFLVVNGKKYVFRKEFSTTSITRDGKYTGIIITDPGRYGEDFQGKAVLFDLTGLSVSKNDKPTFDTIRKVADDLFRKNAALVIFWDSRGNVFPLLYDYKNPEPVNGPVMMVGNGVAEAWLRSKRPPEADIRVSLPRYRTDTCMNVIGYLDNAAPYTIIIGAHYDHIGRDRKNRICYGADDNASGTAMMLELARQLSLVPDKRANYLFIAFSAEEDGLIGSGWFAAHPSIELGTVSFMFNFDMVGRLGCEGNRITVPGTASSPNWKPIYKELDAPFRIKRMKGAAPFSDHAPFYNKGIPVTYFTTGIHSDYHTAGDVAGRINYDGMVSIARLGEDLIRKANDSGKIPFRKIPGWYQFTAFFTVVSEQLSNMTGF